MLLKQADGFTLDMGPFVAALAYAADILARVRGKRSAEFFHAAPAKLGCPAEQTVLVGNNVHCDLPEAVRSSLQGLFVETGKHRPADKDLPECPSAVPGDATEAVDWIIARARAPPRGPSRHPEMLKSISLRR
jgi:ribonucleotide monophosphatase NagD (HAD superfamily)